ncbi:MAG: ATP-binding cassette domain-containing protein [Terriglobia bacterium]
MPIVEVDKLAKYFGEIRAVDGISFDVEEGQIFGFLGPNGAGKTTTINMLCTILRPTAGRARLAGFDVEANPNQVRKSIGLVFQDPSLDEKLTARENLEFHGMIYHIPKKERHQRIDAVLKMVDLEGRQNDYVRVFSGGMKRRLEIARGFIHYPRILFLDEPTLGLDPQSRVHIWDYIKDLRKRESLTIFLTTHYMEEAENCDQIAVIDNGKIIAMDDPVTLKENVKGDMITVKVADLDRAAAEIKDRYGLEVQKNSESIHFEVKGGEEFIPGFVKDFSVPITNVSLHKPTLDDVFLKLTGRAIRDEKAGSFDRMRAFVRGRRRR